MSAIPAAMQTKSLHNTKKEKDQQQNINAGAEEDR